MFFWKELGRSLGRHGKKTAIALLVSAVLGIFLCQFAGNVAVHRHRLRELSENAGLRVTFVNTSGTQSTNILVYDDKLEALEESGLATPGLYAAVCMFSDGTEDDQPDFRNPQRKVQYVAGYTNDTPLAGVGEGNVTYFDGFDASVFATDQAVCLLPQERFDRLGYQPGEKVRIQFFTGGTNERSIFPGAEMDVAVGGTFQDAGPIGPGVGMVIPYRTMRQGLKEGHLSVWPTQAYLDIPDPENLNAIKALLQEIHVSPVDKTLDYYAQYGKTASINDSIYIGTAEPTRRTLSLLQSLYPVVFAAVGLIAMLASYLLMQSRREEIALQRSLGVSRGRVFAAFFGESACLCLAGAAVACLVGVLALDTPLSALGLPLAGYVLSYLLGSGAAILLMLRTDVLAVLAAAE